MSKLSFVSPDDIRAQFSAAMSNMYQNEVPLYQDLMELVSEVNQNVLSQDRDLYESLVQTGEIERLDEERHGAIRVGTAEELKMLRRLFAVMGMFPVGYYDLAPAGVPVHSTVFRAIHEDSLRISPFRIFTSLLRLELIEDEALRDEAVKILQKRNIFTDKVVSLIEKYEQAGGLTQEEARQFIEESLETFRWHPEATVTATQYQNLHNQHRLIADVVAFKGPHINHLTPRTLDIDTIQLEMPKRGINAKAVIEGPPRRECPILLRQTSFKALKEPVSFVDQNSQEMGSHTARFGEIEQRGVALTPKGRALYDKLLNRTRAEVGAPSEENAEEYYIALTKNFKDFPDDYAALHDQKLAYFSYFPTKEGIANRGQFPKGITLNELIDLGAIIYKPIVYEDFLPVSAAGIFQSNLGDEARVNYVENSSQTQFVEDLGAQVLDELEMYEASQARSLERCKEILEIK
ncbi:DUF1338 domain-containing protein [Ignatzschineria indica]|uniref:2-oxoadipate dioxygenase/decarboxylase n=1 Tax=Ignatzschineria indica TaxID=472583 RepID=A0A2U2AJU2_9GAMM|nr:VOC family protein [Ignatzschineria indica]PWD83094.1 DUF1338 domain-containing protein [Ignatzschineria indica]GGZ82981.1 DUF1338 domain-containing protein [Ignatzschineria indica]